MQAGRRRILCAEANKDICNLMILLLEQKGYEVKGAQTVIQSLEMARSEQFDLYVLNDKYTDGDSIELCRELRAIHPETALLLFSLDSSDRRQIPEFGVKHYVSKASDFVSLVETIDALFQSD